MKKYSILNIMISLIIIFLILPVISYSKNNLKKTVIYEYKVDNSRIEYFTLYKKSNPVKNNLRNSNYLSYISYDGKMYKSIDGGKKWFMFEAEDTKKLVFDIYPNPSTDFLNIKLSDLENKIENIAIYNLEGNLQNEFIQFDLKNNSVKVSNLNTGIYILNVKSVNGKSNSIVFCKN